MYSAGEGTPLYKPYSYVPRQRVGFSRCLGLKTAIDFLHFGLESGIVFEETTGVYERIYRLIPIKREIQSALSETYTFGTGNKCPCKRDVRLIEFQVKGVKKGRDQL